MKKKYYRFIILFLGFLLSLIIVNIFFKDLTLPLGYKYKEDDLTFESSIKLDKKKSDQYDLYYNNTREKVYVYINIDNKEELINLGIKNLSLKKYAKTICNDISSAVVKKSENGDYYYFTYEEDNKYFMVSLYENEESFYMITFSVTNPQYKGYEDKFVSWADSVDIK